jgi:DNA-binding Xre family transcriptional regulator
MAKKKAAAPVAKALPKPKPKGITVGTQLRAVMNKSELSNYRINLDTGIDEATLSRFRTGDAGMRLETFERLCIYLGVELRMKVQ